MKDSSSPQNENLSRLSALGMLAAGIAHEIANPAAFVKSNTNYLKRLVKELQQKSGSDPEIASFTKEALEVLEDILEGSIRVERLVKELKGFARSNEKEQTLDLEEILEGAITLTWNRLKRVAHIERRYAHPPAVQGKRGKIEEVFVNLIINAVDAMQQDFSKARIVFKTFSQGDSSCVCIEDNGPGIPKSMLSRIFEPFFTTKGEQGTGLGLYIVKRIVAEHNGNIDVTSRPQVGTCFTVCFPSVLQ